MQALALILAPLPHEREQWDHSPHPCHLLVGLGISSTDPIHSSSRQSLISEGSPEQDPRLPLQARALILEPLPQEVEHWDHSSHCWYWLVIPLTLGSGHSATRQSVVSVGSPEQDPSPLLQARALIFNPLPHELEHWDHSLHPCHSFSSMHLSKRQSLVSVHFPEQDPSLPLQARALIFAPLPQVVEQWDHSLHSCQVKQGCFT